MTIRNHLQDEQRESEQDTGMITVPYDHIHTQQAVIHAQDLAIMRGKRTIWRDAHFTIQSGEFITIVGPNGAGKTTLLRLLLGLLPAIHGTIQVLGNRPQRGNSLIGYVPQRRTLDPDLSVCGRDFVLLGLDGHKWGFPLPFVSKRDQKERAQQAIDAVGATLYADRPVGKLSGGEQQRLLLAQALLGQPKLLLLDEPLASLDLKNQHAIAQLVAHLAQERGITIMLVAHDVNPLLPFTNRVLYIARGHITLGKPDEIITSENLSRLYDAPIEVIRDSRGRILVSGLENSALYPLNT